MVEAYTCEICSLTFDSDEELQDHRSLEHGVEDQASPRFNADDKEHAA